MAVLNNSRHEQFAQGVAKGLSATRAYISAGYSPNGASQAAGKLLRIAEVCSRVQELKSVISAATIQLSITDKNARVKALEDRRQRLMAAIDTRAAMHAENPLGATGLFQLRHKIVRPSRTIKVKGAKGEEPKSVVVPAEMEDEWSLDAVLLRELREIEKQAAMELGQWVEKTEDNVDAEIVQNLARLRQGRERVAKARMEREAAIARGETPNEYEY